MRLLSQQGFSRSLVSSDRNAFVATPRDLMGGKSKAVITMIVALSVTCSELSMCILLVIVPCRQVPDSAQANDLMYIFVVELKYHSTVLQLDCSL
jgi:hypothetical protein